MSGANIKPLSAGTEAARGVIDAYKSSIKEKRSVDIWMEKKGTERGGRRKISRRG